MASSDSQMFSNITEVSRSSLYYGTWQFVLLLHLPDANLLRVLTYKYIDQSIIYRNGWISRRGGVNMISDEDQTILHNACDYFTSRAHPYKKVVSGNGIWVYTNNLEDFEDISTIQGSKVLYVNQARLNLTPDAVILRNPKHAFRTYFRERWPSNDEILNIKRYFQARPDMFRLSPGFAKVVNGKRLWLMSNHFVDHNEPNADFLINLAVPGIVKKTFPIIARGK
jgi:hypothetical protein